MISARVIDRGKYGWAVEWTTIVKRVDCFFAAHPPQRTSAPTWIGRNGE